MGQIKNIKLHIVTDIKCTKKHYPTGRHTSFKMLQQVIQQANKFLSPSARYWVARGKNWVVPAAAWGGFAATIGLYFTEWKVVTEYLLYTRENTITMHQNKMHPNVRRIPYNIMYR